MQILKNTGAVEVKALAGSSARAEPQAASIRAEPSPALTNHTARKKKVYHVKPASRSPWTLSKKQGYPERTQKSVNDGGFGRLTSL